jgi:AcrR family transcriptional regulator
MRTRQAILDAARQIIASEGPGALSMRALAEAIDYSPAGLYEYFASKEDILAEVCAEGMGYLYQAMSAADASLPPEQYLYEIGMAYIRFALEHPDYFLLMFTFSPAPDVSALPEEVVRAALHQEGSAYGILVQAVQRGIQSGAFRERPGFGLEEMTYAAWTLVHGIAMLRTTALHHYPMDLAAADHQALFNFMRGLKAD